MPEDFWIQPGPCYVVHDLRYVELRCLFALWTLRFVNSGKSQSIVNQRTAMLVAISSLPPTTLRGV